MPLLSRIASPAVALAMVIVLALAIRAPFALHEGSPSDVKTIEGWMESAVRFGVGESYKKQIEGSITAPLHGPTAIVIYAGTGHLYRLLFSAEYELLYPTHRIFVKIPGIAADVLVCAALYLIVRKLQNVRWGVIAALVYALHPAAIYDGAIWGQTDAVYTGLFLMTLAAYMYGYAAIGGALIVAAVLQKPQAMLFVPLYGLLMLKKPLRDIGDTLLASAVAFTAILLPFWQAGTLDRVWEVYRNSTHETFRLSWKAFNAWWALLGPTAWDTNGDASFIGPVTYHNTGTAIFLAISAYVLYRLWQRQGSPKATAYVAIETAMVIAFTFFLFAPSMHERYFFPVIALGIPLALRSKREAWLYGGASALLSLNLIMVQRFSTADEVFFARFPGLSTVVAVSLLWICGLWTYVLFAKPALQRDSTLKKARRR